MTEISPDRIDTVRGKQVRTVTRSRAAQWLVVANNDAARATIAHLIEFKPENEMITALSRIETFATEKDARAAFSQIPNEETEESVRRA